MNFSLAKTISWLGAALVFAVPAHVRADGLQNPHGVSGEGAGPPIRPTPGSAAANAALGDAYLTGNGVPQDVPTALRLLQSAANQGNALAEFDLGAIYDNGQDGLPRDPATAAYWYQLAAAQGDIRSEDNLARMYYSGIGVPQDYGKAFQLYQAAADKGELRAAFALGAMYALGQSVPKDNELDYIWMSIAADHETDPILGPRYRHFRDQQAATLSPAALADAQARAAHWCPCGNGP